MDLQRLQELIEFPERIEASDREGLEAWSEKYPYAGAIAMLLARASAVIKGGEKSATVWPHREATGTAKTTHCGLKCSISAWISKGAKAWRRTLPWPRRRAGPGATLPRGPKA